MGLSVCHSFVISHVKIATNMRKTWKQSELASKKWIVEKIQQKITTKTLKKHEDVNGIYDGITNDMP